MPSDQAHVIFNFIAYTLISIIHFAQPLLSLLQFALFSLFFIIGTLIGYYWRSQNEQQVQKRMQTVVQALARKCSCIIAHGRESASG